MLFEGVSRRAVGYLGRDRHADAEESMAKHKHLGSMQDCKKSLSAPFTTLKCTILDADQLSCFGAKIFVKFRAVAVRFFAGSPFHTDAFHWNFLFLMRHSDSKHSNSALTQCFQCICSEVQASATLAVSREAPICFVALPHCMMFSS